MVDKSSPMRRRTPDGPDQPILIGLCRDLDLVAFCVRLNGTDVEQTIKDRGGIAMDIAHGRADLGVGIFADRLLQKINQPGLTLESRQQRQGFAALRQDDGSGLSLRRRVNFRRGRRRSWANGGAGRFIRKQLRYPAAEFGVDKYPPAGLERQKYASHARSDPDMNLNAKRRQRTSRDGVRGVITCHAVIIAGTSATCNLLAMRPQSIPFLLSRSLDDAHPFH